MKKLKLFIIYFLPAILLNAQPEIEWQTCLGGSQNERCLNVIENDQSEIIIGGQTWSNDGNVSGNHGNDNPDAWVVNLDANGNLQWQKCYGGTGGEDVRRIIQTTDGGYIFTGSTSSNDGDISGFHGEFDCNVIKLNPVGEIEWQKCYGGSEEDGGQIIIQAIDGGYVVCGYTYSTDGDITEHNGFLDIWVIKISETGDIEWQKCYGGTGYETPGSVVAVDDGYVVTGAATSNDGMVSGNNGMADTWVFKIDTTGNLIWQHCFGGSSDDYAISISPVGEGTFTFAGTTFSYDGDVVGNNSQFHAIWLVNFNDAGEINWQNCLSGTMGEVCYGMYPTSDGGYLLTGNAFSNDGSLTGFNGGYTDFWNVKAAPDGQLLWEHCYGGSGEEESRWILETSDGSIVTLGYTTSNDGDVSGNHGEYDIWVFKQEVQTLVDSFTAKEIDIFPNPAEDFLSILVSDKFQGEYSGRIMDINGKLVQKYHIINNGKIDISNLPNGVYILELFQASSKLSFKKKFIKK